MSDTLVEDPVIMLLGGGDIELYRIAMVRASNELHHNCLMAKMT